MGIVRTPQLEPGMTLAEDVRDVNGRLLLNKGSRLEQSHIRIFKIWGITEVNILGNGGAKVKIKPKVTSELIEKTKEVLAYESYSKLKAFTEEVPSSNSYSQIKARSEDALVSVGSFIQSVTPELHGSILYDCRWLSK